MEDLVYIRSVDLFVLRGRRWSALLWDLHTGELKLTYATRMTPEECLLSLAAGEDSCPFVS